MQRESVVGPRRHLDVLAAGDEHARQIRDVARVRAQHLVPWIDDRLEGDIQRLAHPRRHDDLGARVVVHSVQPLQVARDRVPQLDEAVVRRVVGLAVLEAADRRLPDVIRRHEVRLSDPERDHAVHARQQVEEAADPRRRDRLHVLRDIPPVCVPVRHARIPARCWSRR